MLFSEQSCLTLSGLAPSSYLLVHTSNSAIGGKKAQKLLLQSSHGCCVHVFSVENAQWFSSQYLPCCWWEVHFYVKAASQCLPQAIEAFSVRFWAPAPLFAVLGSSFAPRRCSRSSGWRKNRDCMEMVRERGKSLWQLIPLHCKQTGIRGCSWLSDAIKSRGCISVVGKETHSWVCVNMLGWAFCVCEFLLLFFLTAPSKCW